MLLYNASGPLDVPLIYIFMALYIFHCIINSLILQVPAIVLSFLYGSLSDHYSRRLALALPSVGQALSMANYVLNSYMMDWDVGFLLVGQIISGEILCYFDFVNFKQQIKTEFTSNSPADTHEVCIISLK